MIRVRILADSPERRRRIAELLAEDERIDVLDGLAPSSFADVTIADGRGNKEIAGELGISDHTAKFHVSQILAKLGAGSRTEAVMIGIRRGLVPI